MKKLKKSSFSMVGVLSFFALIAFTMQVAILVYDYIIKRTVNKGIIAVLILILVIILSVIITVFDFLRRKIMVERPVKRIINATEKIASGDFNTKLEIAHTYDKYNEFDVIMENLNTMSAELSKSEILKSDFISNVSHEIKTPLSVIQSYATLLQDDSLDNESRQKYSKILLQASKRLSDLITNILKLNKLENQTISPEYKKLNLTDTVAEIVIGYEEIIEKKGIELECDFDDIMLVSNSGYIEIIINNLLSNAIKFTDKNGKIKVSLKSISNGGVIKVSDTGCGIPKETGKRIFERFYQCDTSHASEGNGLGLALVKKVIDIMGGEISVTSEISKGSEFTVVLKNVEADI
ncbi:MAG: HAMP domain-containing histidine kinase [Clostridia bacterium]|nr:HAMP domain-containing histidine kinase [Clostridia bacterium]